jgi:hypothetical protein
MKDKPHEKAVKLSFIAPMKDKPHVKSSETVLHNADEGQTSCKKQ